MHKKEGTIPVSIETNSCTYQKIYILFFNVAINNIEFQYLLLKIKKKYLQLKIA